MCPCQKGNWRLSEVLDLPGGVYVTFEHPSWELIGHTREYLHHFCRLSYGDAGLAERVAMAAHELLENAVKYGNQAEGPVRCTLQRDQNHLRLLVANGANPDQMAALRAELETVNTGDPLEVYLAKMEASLGSDKSQLGLARIRYEGEAQLRIQEDPPMLVLEALFELPN